MGGRPMTTGFAEKPVEFVKLHRYRMIYRIRKKKHKNKDDDRSFAWVVF